MRKIQAHIHIYKKINRQKEKKQEKDEKKEGERRRETDPFIWDFENQPPLHEHQGLTVLFTPLYNDNFYFRGEW